jgi:hypothetical protein
LVGDSLDAADELADAEVEEAVVKVDGGAGGREARRSMGSVRRGMDDLEEAKDDPSSAVVDGLEDGGSEWYQQQQCLSPALSTALKFKHIDLSLVLV